jgi:hypothetical protein
LQRLRCLPAWQTELLRQHASSRSAHRRRYARVHHGAG